MAHKRFIGARVVSGIIAIPAIWLAISAARNLITYRDDMFPALGVFVMSIATLLIIFAVGGHHAVVRGRVVSAISWGSIVGMIAGALGVVIPMFISQSNLGPLIGILGTGPLGFVLGAIGGAIFAHRSQRHDPGI